SNASCVMRHRGFFAPDLRPTLTARNSPERIQHKTVFGVTAKRSHTSRTESVLLIAATLLPGDGLAGALGEQWLHEVGVEEDCVASGQVGEAARFGLGTEPAGGHAEQSSHRPQRQQSRSGRFHDPIKPLGVSLFPLSFRRVSARKSEGLRTLVGDSDTLL